MPNDDKNIKVAIIKYYEQRLIQENQQLRWNRQGHWKTQNTKLTEDDSLQFLVSDI